MKIAMVGLKGIPFPAGVEAFTEQVGWRLAERGHEVVVYSRPYVQMDGEYRGMQVRRLPSINTKHLDALSHTLLATLHVLASDADIVHYHAIGPSVFSFLPRLRGMATLAQVHGHDWQRAKWSAFAKACLRLGEYAAMYFPTRTLAVSRTLQRHLEAAYGRTVDYVPPGISPGVHREPGAIRQWGLEQGTYILFLARLVPEKGCHYLIEAFESLQTDKKLVIAGPESHSASYAGSLHRTNHPGILFVGAVGGELLQELFSNAYLYVLPSEMEGLPATVLEALSYGKCVLASDIEPNVEALGEHCGITFRSRDVEDLRSKLGYLLTHPEVVSERSARAVERVGEYSWDSVVDRLEKAYEASCRPRSARADRMA